MIAIAAMPIRVNNSLCDLETMLTGQFFGQPNSRSVKSQAGQLD